MKKLVVCVIAFVAISLSLSAQIEMDINGNVTIKNGIIMDNSGYYGRPAIHSSSGNLDLGTAANPVYKITSYYYQWISDKRQKENIRDINNSLDIVLGLKGVKYDIKKEFAYTDGCDDKLKEKLDITRKNQIGFLAQDVEKILPEVVYHDDSTDIYGIDYARIVPILVEAIKEQQLLIEVLSQSKNSNKSGDMGSNENAEPSSNNMLYQNTPNPFTKSTEIKYVIGENVQNTMLNIYNLNGTQLKTIPINKTGKGSITINSNEFGAGMYLYALIADGQIIDTKQMVLTD